jgi:hypothetical protein
MSSPSQSSAFAVSRRRSVNHLWGTQARKEPKMEFGLYTFADVGPEIDPARRLHNLLEAIELAD